MGSLKILRLPVGFLGENLDFLHFLVAQTALVEMLSSFRKAFLGVGVVCGLKPSSSWSHSSLRKPSKWRVKSPEHLSVESSELLRLESAVELVES